MKKAWDAVRRKGWRAVAVALLTLGPAFAGAAKCAAEESCESGIVTGPNLDCVVFGP